MKSYRLYVAGAFVDAFESVGEAVGEVLSKPHGHWEVKDAQTGDILSCGTGETPAMPSADSVKRSN